jgi:hypothetical protein
MVHRWRLLAVALAVLLVLPGGASAQVPVPWPVVLRATAGWLLSLVTHLSAGVVLDQLVDAATVQDHEAELTAIQFNLQKALKKSISTNASIAEVKLGLASIAEVKLGLAKATSELEILRSLIRKAPTAEDIARFRAKLESEIIELDKIVGKHEKLLQQHGQELRQQRKTLRKQGGEIAELQRRLDQQQEPPPGPPRSLTVMVEGASNVIRLHPQRWCEVSGSALASGVVHVSGPEIVVDYCIARGTGAVVELGAPSAWVSMPSSLNDLVEIHDNGWTFQRWVYPDP